MSRYLSLPASACVTCILLATGVARAESPRTTSWAGSVVPLLAWNQGLTCEPVDACGGEHVQSVTAPGVELGFGLQHAFASSMGMQARVFGRYAFARRSGALPMGDATSYDGSSLETPSANVWLAGVEATARFFPASSWYLGLGPRFGYHVTRGQIEGKTASGLPVHASYDNSGAFVGGVVEVGTFVGDRKQFELGARLTGDVHNEEMALAPGLMLAWLF